VGSGAGMDEMQERQISINRNSVPSFPTCSLVTMPTELSHCRSAYEITEAILKGNVNRFVHFYSTEFT